MDYENIKDKIILNLDFDLLYRTTPRQCSQGSPEIEMDKYNIEISTFL